MSKQNNSYKGKLPFQSEFDHRYACWATNHRGWAKMKKFNKRLAKRRLRDEMKKDDEELTADADQHSERIDIYG